MFNYLRKNNVVDIIDVNDEDDDIDMHMNRNMKMNNEDDELISNNTPYTKPYIKPYSKPYSKPYLEQLNPKQQIMDVKKEEELLGDLDMLSEKYRRFQKENINTIINDNTEYGELLKEKDFIINDLKNENKELRQKIIDITILYNTKIENIKTEHKKELYRIHSEFVERLNKKL